MLLLNYMRWHHRPVSITAIELLPGVLITLAEYYLDDVPRSQYDVTDVSVIHL